MIEPASPISRRSFLGGAAALGVSTLALSASPLTAFGVTAAQKQAEADAALNALVGYQEELDRASADYFTAIDEQTQAQEKMDEAQKRIDETSERISAIQDQLGSRARSMYRNGSYSFLDLLLGATTFQAFASNWDLLNDINEDDARMVQESKDLRTEVQNQKAVYAEQESVARQKAQDAAVARSNAEAVVNEQQALYNSLSSEALALLEQEQAARAAAESAAAAARALDLPNQAAPEAGAEATEDQAQSFQGTTPPYVAAYGNAVADRAYSYLGKATYVWASCAPGAFDCSGFVSYCLTGEYSRVGTTYEFMNWPQPSDPQIGDVCTNSSHCGIYVGGGQMIHCSSYQNNVVQDGMQAGMIIVRPPW